MSAPRSTPDQLTAPDFPLDHPPLTTLDRIAALAARLLAVPLALICLGDEEVQRRSETVCAVAALSDETYAVMTSIGDRRLLADPAIAREYFAYHAGVPVRDAAGRTLGAVYVMDPRPRAPSARDAALLGDVAALAADQLETHRALRSLADADVALRSVAQATASLTGEAYCRALVAALALALRVDYAFVAEVADAAGGRARMVALHANGTVVDDVEYALRGTPCHEVVADGMCIVPSGARQRYPDDTLLGELEVEGYMGAVIPAADGGRLGWVAIMDRRPLPQSSETAAILRLCAARAGAELQRRAADVAMRLTHEALERTLAEQSHALHLEREKLTKAFRSSPDPIALTSVADGRLLEVNDAFVTQHGFAREEVLGRSVLDLNIWVHPAQRQRMLERLRAEGAVRAFEFEFRRRSGERRVALLSAELIDVAGESCVLAVVHDVTAAFHDELTGLPNRVLFMDRLGRAVERTRRHLDTRAAVLFVDVDRFKMVNDSLGHAAGDRLLVAVARQLQTCLRPEDTVARFGGDEFAILLEDVGGIDDAIRVADRIQRVLTLPVSIDGQEVFCSVSIGIALGTAGERGPEDLLRDADTALYGAKAAGRACYEIFDTAMHAHAVAQLRLETEVRQAVEREEFRLHYQPIVASGDGRIVGFEALLRWAHPTRGILLPGEFLSMAEDTGLIVPIGRNALREACRRARAWQERLGDAAPWVSVNLCSRQFLQPSLVSEIAGVLEETGLAPHRLMLEITENVIMDNASSLTTTLGALRDLGIRLSIDDFGTGYSSLSHLHEFPIDTLKIDRSFIRRLGPNGGNGETVRAIVTLAHNLTKTVIAEGVETAEQLTQLRALACDFVQGFLFSASVDAAAADALLPRTA